MLDVLTNDVNGVSLEGSAYAFAYGQQLAAASMPSVRSGARPPLRRPAQGLVIEGRRPDFAGQDIGFLTGGAGFAQAPPRQNANGAVVGAGQGAHIGVIGLVLIAVVILFVLDKAGFRFAVTAGSAR
jgi:hypothetical protein